MHPPNASAQAAILRMTGADDTAVLADLAKLPETQAAVPGEETAYADAALWHGAMDHVEQMIACGVQGGVLPYESGVKIKSGHASAGADGAEHIVAEIAAHIPEGSAVGVGGNNGRVGHVHDVPKGLIAEVADIHGHTHPLRFLYKGPALICQTTAGQMRTGQRVLLVPGQRHHSKTDKTQVLQYLRVVANACRTLQGQDSRSLALFQVLPDIIRAVSQTDLPAVLGNLPLDGSQLPFEDQYRRNAVPLIHLRSGKASKTLGVAWQAFGPNQIDMALVLLQAAGAVTVLPQQGQGGITMQVKDWIIH